MLAVLFGAQQSADGATGARIGRWIDGHTGASVTIAVVSVAVVVLTVTEQAESPLVRTISMRIPLP